MSSLAVKMDVSEDKLRGISPTDISQFIRLEQCERYLRLRLHEKSVDRNFMYDYGVVPQSIPPLLTLSGSDFEKEVETTVSKCFRKVNFVTDIPSQRNEIDDNGKVISLARSLPNGEIIILFQSRLQVELDGWQIRGDVDIIRLEREINGLLRILIVDMKSSTSAKVE